MSTFYNNFLQIKCHKDKQKKTWGWFPVFETNKAQRKTKKDRGQSPCLKIYY